MRLPKLVASLSNGLFSFSIISQIFVVWFSGLVLFPTPSHSLDHSWSNWGPRFYYLIPLHISLLFGGRFVVFHSFRPIFSPNSAVLRSQSMK